MFGILLKHRVKNAGIRKRKGLTEVIQGIADMKKRWLGDVSRQEIEKWTSRVVQSRSDETKKSKIDKNGKDTRWVMSTRGLLRAEGRRRTKKTPAELSFTFHLLTAMGIPIASLKINSILL